MKHRLSASPPPAVRRWTPSVTVAAIIDDGVLPLAQRRYLLVEEHTPEGLRLNNPAGHLEAGETPEAAVVREALEETARVFTPLHFLGLYLSRFRRPVTGEDVTYLRLAFSGSVGPELQGRSYDQPIVRTLWMSLAEVKAARPRLRSEMVLQCLIDHAAGHAHPLSMVSDDGSLAHPIVKQAGTAPAAAKKA